MSVNNQGNHMSEKYDDLTKLIYDKIVKTSIETAKKENTVINCQHRNPLLPSHMCDKAHGCDKNCTLMISELIRNRMYLTDSMMEYSDNYQTTTPSSILTNRDHDIHRMETIFRQDNVLRTRNSEDMNLESWESDDDDTSFDSD